MNEPRSEVVVVDIRMPFWSMVIFLVKLAIASIPAFMLLTLLGFLLAALFGGLTAGVGTLKSSVGGQGETHASAAPAGTQQALRCRALSTWSGVCQSAARLGAQRAA